LCDRALWPLLHGFLDKVRFEPADWRAYVEVNRRFARIAAAAGAPGGRIWIHDFQLALVPGALRQAGHAGRVDLFLHAPIPPLDLFRAFPWRDPLLRGVLAADTVGVQGVRDRDHLVDAATLVGGRAREVAGGIEVTIGDRACFVHASPVAIDVTAFEDASRDADVRAESARLRRAHRGRPILLAADRLDYTKGILERFRAVEALLERDAAAAGSFDLVQVVVPSRNQVQEYRELRSRLDREVGRINGEWARDGWVPIHYRFRGLERGELVAGYLAAAAAIVTPLRDGMNLVAPEFVASRTDEDGVLVLSEFAGAAGELDAALSVNPWDVEGYAAALAQALAMPAPERRRRMVRLRERVRARGVDDWARSCLDLLAPRVHALAP
jgi:trehalose-6-phosphate synthase